MGIIASVREHMAKHKQEVLSNQKKEYEQNKAQLSKLHEEKKILAERNKVENEVRAEKREIRNLKTEHVKNKFHVDEIVATIAEHKKAVAQRAKVRAGEPRRIESKGTVNLGGGNGSPFSNQRGGFFP